MEDDEPGEAELRPLLREALAALRRMQRDESVRPKLKEFAEGSISASELRLWLQSRLRRRVTNSDCAVVVT